jgi:hypothetical protein
MKYLIWSTRKNAWYGPNCAGYTEQVSAAGRYERDALSAIVTGALPGQLIPVDAVLAQNALSELRGAEVTAQLDEYRSY